jgi:hypothetical protein
VNATEDRLRAAGRAVAVTVPPDSVPSLRLPAPAPPEADLRGLGRRWPRGRRPGWLAPLAAAAAVVAVIALSVAVARGQSSGAPAGTAAGPLGTPAYYVTLAAPAGPAGVGAAAVVRRTATGQAFARVTAPGSGVRFTMVAAAPDDRTFVLGAQARVHLDQTTTGPSSSSGSGVSWRVRVLPGTPTAFYLLRFDPARRQARLSRLPVPAATEPVSGLALSPDGTKLAVATTPPGRMKITVSTLATGTSRTWTGRWSRHVPAPAFNSLYWTGPAKVTFVWSVPGSRQNGTAPDTTVRRLDLTAQETSLHAASTDLPGVAAGRWSTAVSPQGLQVKFQPGLAPYRGIAAWPTDQRWLFLARRSAQGTWRDISRTPHALWSNPAGTVLIANVAGHQIDVVGQGRFVTLPAAMPATALGIAW